MSLLHIVCCYLLKIFVCINNNLLLLTILHEAEEFTCDCLKTCMSPVPSWALFTSLTTPIKVPIKIPMVVAM
jgi:hypothetical protein